MLKSVAIAMAIAAAIAGPFLLAARSRHVSMLALVALAGAFGLAWHLVRERRRRQIRKLDEMRDSALW